MSTLLYHNNVSISHAVLYTCIVIKTLIMCRHGITPHNHKMAGKKVTGDLHKLTTEGRADSKQMGRVIDSHGFKIDRCFYSPLDRTRQTAEEAFRDKNIPFKKAPGLIECSLGDLQDIESDVYYKSDEWKKDRERKERDYINYRPPNGETYIEARRRVLKELNTANDLHPDGVVAFVMSARIMAAAFTLDELLGFTHNDLKRAHGAWPNPRWVQNNQYVAITREDPVSAKLFSRMTFYRVVSTRGTKFDTNWTRIPGR